MVPQKSVTHGGQWWSVVARRSHRGTSLMVRLVGEDASGDDGHSASLMMLIDAMTIGQCT